MLFAYKFSIIKVMKTFFGVISKQKVSMYFSENFGRPVLKSNEVGCHFSRIFRNFAQIIKHFSWIFRDFCQNFHDFAWTFWDFLGYLTNQKLLGSNCTPCTFASYTTASSWLDFIIRLLRYAYALERYQPNFLILEKKS